MSFITIKRVVKNCNRMMLSRGYECILGFDPIFDTFDSADFEQKRKHGFVSMWRKDKKNDLKIVINDSLKDYVERHINIKNSNLDNILITSLTHMDQANKIKEKNKTKTLKLELFFYADSDENKTKKQPEDFLLDLSNHFAVPKHTFFKLGDNSEFANDDFLKVNYKLLPNIKVTDPVARWYGAEVGNIAAIERINSCTDVQVLKSMEFRVVV